MIAFECDLPGGIFVWGEIDLCFGFLPGAAGGSAVLFDELPGLLRRDVEEFADDLVGELPATPPTVVVICLHIVAQVIARVACTEGTRHVDPTRAAVLLSFRGMINMKVGI